MQADKPSACIGWQTQNSTHHLWIHIHYNPSYLISMPDKPGASEGRGQVPSHDQDGAESVFSDSEEGELLVGRREVASDAEEDDVDATAEPRSAPAAGGESPSGQAIASRHPAQHPFHCNFDVTLVRYNDYGSGTTANVRALQRRARGLVLLASWVIPLYAPTSMTAGSAGIADAAALRLAELSLAEAGSLSEGAPAAEDGKTLLHACPAHAHILRCPP
jgi:hypothetical protein